MRIPNPIALPLMILFLLAAGTIPLAAQDDDPEELYASLLERVMKGDSTVDFGLLRMTYARTDDYNPYNFFITQKDEMFKALHEERYDDALEQAGSILEENYLLVEAHLACLVAYTETGNTAKRDYHQWMINGIIASVMGSNDGKTPETAYKVISIAEEYALLHMFGLERKKQRLFEENGMMYDGLEVVDIETGEKQEIFFNVDIPLRSTSKE